MNLTEANDDDEMSNVALGVFYGGTNPGALALLLPADPLYDPLDEVGLDMTLSVTEVGAGGFVDMLYASISLELLDVIGESQGLSYNIDVEGNYDTGDLKPYFGFGYGTDEVLDLNAGVELYEGLTGIDNTTVTLHYESTDLTATAPAVIDKGVITAEVAIEY